MLLAAHGEAGPEIYGRPVFPQMLGNFADKWVNGKSPVQCAPAFPQLDTPRPRRPAAPRECEPLAGFRRWGSASP